MVNHFKTWVSKVLGIPDLRNENRALRAAMARMESRFKILEERDRLYQNVAVDVGYKCDPSMIITIGHYRGRRYVNLHSVPGGEFSRLVDHLRSFDRASTQFHIDGPYSQMIYEMLED